MTITYTVTITYGPTNSTLTLPGRTDIDIATLLSSMGRSAPSDNHSFNDREANSVFVIPTRVITSVYYEPEHQGPVTWKTRRVAADNGLVSTLSVATSEETQ